MRCCRRRSVLRGWRICGVRSSSFRSIRMKSLSRSRTCRGRFRIIQRKAVPGGRCQSIAMTHTTRRPKHCMLRRPFCRSRFRMAVGRRISICPARSGCRGRALLRTTSRVGWGRMTLTSLRIRTGTTREHLITTRRIPSCTTLPGCRRRIRARTAIGFARAFCAGFITYSRPSIRTVDGRRFGRWRADITTRLRSTTTL